MDLAKANLASFKVLQCAFKIHKALGPGLLESVYEECLAFEMNKAGLAFDRQLGLPLRYEGILMEVGYRVDFRVEGNLILEIKACEAICDIHIAQVLTYLKISSCRLGLLINFNVPKLKNGIKRLIL